MTQHPRFSGSLMAALGENFDWYIGRDGKQFGPVNSAEMGKLIELGHLRPTDLVWRAGLADWQSAESVFNLSAANEPPPPEPAPSLPASPEPTASRASEPQPAQTPGATAAAAAAARAFADTTAPQSVAYAAPQSVVQPLPQVAPARPHVADAAAMAPRAEQSAGRDRRPSPAAPAPARAQPRPEDPLRLDDIAAAINAKQPAATHPASIDPPFEPREPSRQAQRPAAQRAAPQPAAPVVASPPRERPAGVARDVGDAGSKGVPPHHRKQPRAHPPHDHSRKRRRSRAAMAIALSALAVVVSAAAAAYVWREQVVRTVANLTGANFAGAAKSGSTDGAEKQAPAAKAAPRVVAEPGSLAAATAVESSALWTLLRTEFPEWYGERLREATRIRNERRDDAAVSRYLMEQVVQLRRNYADDALSSAPEGLLNIARNFVTSLVMLNRESVDACYGFISTGETSNAIMPLLARQDVSATFEGQLIAIFEAVADGRRNRVAHLPPRKSDYDQLVRLLVSRGWTEQDLQTFSDPRTLAQSQPAVTCRLVREWFQGQLALEDEAAKVRLLVESLRPVVGG